MSKRRHAHLEKHLSYPSPGNPGEGRAEQWHGLHETPSLTLPRSRVPIGGTPPMGALTGGGKTLLALGLLSIMLSGCGYTWSNNGNSFAPQPFVASNNLYREDVRTVAVPIFTNQTFSRGVEFALSKAIVNHLESDTPYKTAPPERADTVLQGQINTVGVRNISRSPFNALPQEQLFYVSVNFTWKDLRTGKILVERHAFEQTAPYYPTLGEDPYVGSQDNVEKLARAIVEELQAPWGKKQDAETRGHGDAEK